MQRLFSTFPGGAPGGGLLLLRAAAGLTAMTHGIGSLSSQSDRTILLWVGGAIASASGFSMLLGLLTPFAGAVVALTGVAVLSSWLPPALYLSADAFSTSFLIVVALAIALLGPGAYSLDAYLFGRREIVIPDPPSSREH